MSYMLLNIVGILGAMILGVVLVYLMGAVRAQEGRSQQPATPPNPLVQQTLALMAATRTLIRR